MKHLKHSFLKKFCNPLFLLFMFWILGLFTGLSFAVIAADSSFSLMHLAACTQVSIVSLLSMLAIPILVTDILVRYHLYFFIYPIAFLKALTYSFCSSCVLITFGDSGWLVRILLIFSDSVMCVALLLWWTFSLSGKVTSKYLAVGIGVVSICIGVLDYFYISPFLTDLMKFG